MTFETNALSILMSYLYFVQFLLILICLIDCIITFDHSDWLAEISLNIYELD